MDPPRPRSGQLSPMFRARYALMAWLRLRKNIRNAYILADLPFAGVWQKARFRMFCLLILVCLSLFWYSRVCVSMLHYRTLLSLGPTLAQLSAICEPLCAKAMKTQRRAQYKGRRSCVKVESLPFQPFRRGPPRERQVGIPPGPSGGTDGGVSA